MKALYERFFDKLKNSTKVVFMGIGEEKLTDDGVGPYIISELLSHSNEKVLFINAGIDPMSRIDDIINFFPSHLVILDTCTLDKPPGTVAIIERENIADYLPISSHTIPIHIVIDLILEKLPNLIVFMIGFVPKSLEGFSKLKQYKEHELTIDELSENIDYPFFEIHLTETVRKAADQVIKMIRKVLKVL